MRSTTRALLAAFTLTAFCACSSNGKIPEQYSIKGEGASVLNRDSSGKSLSVVVRIYQLRDANEFSKMTFDTVAAGYPESDLLGGSLLEKIEVVLVPGGTYTSSEKLHEETRFIGVVGLFRNPDPHHWRQLVETHDASGNRIGGLAFLAQDCHLTILGPRTLLLPGQPTRPTGDCGQNDLSSFTAPRSSITRSATHERRPPAGSVLKQSSVRHPSPSMPQVNVNTPTAIMPTNVRVGGTSGTTVTIGDPSPPVYYSPPGTYTPTR